MTLNSKIIKHARNKDVCYYITKCYDVGHKLKLKAMIFNMAFTRSYALGVNCNIIIRKEDMHDWHICLEPDVACLRYAEWKRL